MYKKLTIPTLFYSNNRQKKNFKKKNHSNYCNTVQGHIMNNSTHQDIKTYFLKQGRRLYVRIFYTSLTAV